MTSWSPNVAGVDEVFRALADPTRRALLDELFRRDGRSLRDLEARFTMTRFGVMKHLRVLEEAGLVVSSRRGREKAGADGASTVEESKDAETDLDVFVPDNLLPAGGTPTEEREKKPERTPARELAE